MLALFDVDRQGSVGKDPPYVISHERGIFLRLTRAKKQGLVNNNPIVFMYSGVIQPCLCDPSDPSDPSCSLWVSLAKGQQVNPVVALRRPPFGLHSHLTIDQQQDKPLAQVKQ